jgi:hypothetical protein
VTTNGRRAGKMGDVEEALSPLDAMVSWFNPPSWNSDTTIVDMANDSFRSFHLFKKIFRTIMQLLFSALYTYLVAKSLLLVYDENCFINILHFLQF